MNTGKTDILDPHIRDYIDKHSLDTVEGAFAWNDGEDLVKPGLGNRRRTRIYFCDMENRCWELYMKRYYPRTFFGRLWSLVTGRGFRCEAVSEFDNIRALRDAGVPTMREIACGFDSDLLGVKRGYVIVSAVPGDALERCGDEFVARNAVDSEMITELTDKLVSLVARMHIAGFVHRDLYASHIFLYEHDGVIELNLIDLARVFRPVRRQFRWRVKDLAQLKYSMPPAWVSYHWDRFISEYLDMTGQNDRPGWDLAISSRIDRMHKRQQRHDKSKPQGNKDENSPDN